MSRRGSEGHALRLSAVEEDILTLLVGRELYGLAMLEASKSAVGGTEGAPARVPLYGAVQDGTEGARALVVGQ